MSGRSETSGVGRSKQTKVFPDGTNTLPVSLRSNNQLFGEYWDRKTAAVVELAVMVSSCFTLCES